MLRGFGLKAWEISPRDLRNLDKLIAAGKLPEGRPVGELLMHYDEESDNSCRMPMPHSSSHARGSLGLIEMTDRVVKTENLAAWPASRSRLFWAFASTSSRSFRKC